MSCFGNLPLLFTILEICHYNFYFPWTVPFYTADYPLGPSTYACISILPKLPLSSSSVKKLKSQNNGVMRCVDSTRRGSGGDCRWSAGAAVLHIHHLSRSLSSSSHQLTADHLVPFPRCRWRKQQGRHKGGCEPDDPAHQRRAAVLQRSWRRFVYVGPHLTAAAWPDLWAPVWLSLPAAPWQPAEHLMRERRAQEPSLAAPWGGPRARGPHAGPGTSGGTYVADRRRGHHPLLGPVSAWLGMFGGRVRGIGCNTSGVLT